MKSLKRRQRLGKYRIDGRLAEGGFAMVYRATDLIEGLSVALKVPHPETTTAEDVTALQREVRVTARLEHPGILPLKDASIIDGVFVLVSPLGKETLHERLRRRVSLTTALVLAEQMVAAVAYAHRNKVLHLDIKPENFILFPDGRVRLGDFGIAKIARGTKALKGSGTGTVGYVAPEQALGRPSFKSDVFSLSLVLYRMFTGHLPDWPFKWPLVGHDRLEATAGPEMVALLRRGLEVDGSKRFKDASVLEQRLSRVLKKRKRDAKKANIPEAERHRAATVVAGQSLEKCRRVRLGPGRAVLFARPRPDSPGRKNEDVVGVVPVSSDRCALVVADGCGGMPSGGKAAELAVRELHKAIAEGGQSRRRMRDAVLDGIERGNRAVIALKRGAGTTLAAVSFEAGSVQPMHVGDAGVLVCGSRGRVKHHTMDHGPVGDAVRAGILDEEDAPFHEESHVVSNLLGSPEMWVELGPRLELARRDTVVLGSDGLFGNLSNDEIAAVVRTGDLLDAGDKLATLCLARMEDYSGPRPPAPDDLGFVLFRMSG